MYLKLTTQVLGYPAITVAKAAKLAGYTNVSTINIAIKAGTLDHGYAFDELEKDPPETGRPDADTSKFGQKLVVQNEKWAAFLITRSSKK